MRCSRVLMMLLMLVLLGGCSAYHPLSGGVGYTEVPLGQEAFQVTFSGEGAMPVAEVRQHALTRAAELTVLRGRSHFEILDERVFVGYGESYTPPTYYPAYGGRHWGRRGWGGYGGMYHPGHVQTYTIPEVTVQVRLAAADAPGAIPAAYLLRQARARNVKLSPGVEERLSSLPVVSGEVTLPPAPQAVERER